MPLLKFKSFLAASRRRNMNRFGMVRVEDASFLDVIDDAAADPVGLTGTQDGSNVSFTISAPISKLFRNGILQKPTVDYSVSGNTLTWVTAPISDDIILGFTE